MSTKKITKEEAIILAKNFGINFKSDFYTLNSEKTNYLADLAKKTGYTKPKNASGSTARYFFQHLAKKTK